MTWHDGLTKNEYFTAMLSRQVPLVGEAGMKRLGSAVVAHAGLGGGGSITLEMLARAGIRRFRLLDRDCYEPSNLNRQIFATTKTVGRPKVEVAAERLWEINPHIVIEKSYHEPVSVRNVEEMLDGADIGMVCTDSPSSHIIFQQVARRKRIRLILGAGARHGASVWVLPYDTSSESKGPISLAVKLIHKLRGGVDINSLTEEEAIAMDKIGVPTGGFTPTISYVPNCAGILATALAIKYLCGMDLRPQALNIDFQRFHAVGPIEKAFQRLKQALKG